MHLNFPNTFYMLNMPCRVKINKDGSVDRCRKSSLTRGTLSEKFTTVAETQYKIMKTEGLGQECRPTWAFQKQKLNFIKNKRLSWQRNLRKQDQRQEAQKQTRKPDQHEDCMMFPWILNWKQSFKRLRMTRIWRTAELNETGAKRAWWDWGTDDTGENTKNWLTQEQNTQNTWEQNSSKLNTENVSKATKLPLIFWQIKLQCYHLFIFKFCI